MSYGFLRHASDTPQTSLCVPLYEGLLMPPPHTQQSLFCKYASVHCLSASNTGGFVSLLQSSSRKPLHPLTAYLYVSHCSLGIRGTNLDIHVSILTRNNWLCLFSAGVYSGSGVSRHTRYTYLPSHCHMADLASRNRETALGPSSMSSFPYWPPLCTIGAVVYPPIVIDGFHCTLYIPRCIENIL